VFNTRALSNRIPGIPVAAMLCIAMLSFVLTPKAAADLGDQKTIVTFSAPVEIPGKVLPAGTYVFKRLDAAGNRNIVQIFDKDEMHLIATLLALPDYRLKTPEKPIINFEERAANSPEAIKAWFYPGDNYGVQFVYPHTRATEIAKRTNQNVLSMRDEMTKNINAQSKTANDASVRELQKTDVTGVNPSGEPVDLIVVISTVPGQK
jgi:hypothetical protein